MFVFEGFHTYEKRMLRPDLQCIMQKRERQQIATHTISTEQCTRLSRVGIALYAFLYDVLNVYFVSIRVLYANPSINYSFEYEVVNYGDFKERHHVLTCG